MGIHDGALLAPASSEPPVGTVRAQNLCGMDPLVAVPHTSMCMGVDSFTERTGVSARDSGDILRRSRSGDLKWTLGPKLT